MDARHDIVPMDSPERCPRTELIRTQCAHCRPPQLTFVEALFDPPGDEDDVITATFPAQFGGRCMQCDGFFESGEWISRTGTGDYMCSDCAP